MKTLIINGSPRQNGSTMSMINIFIKNIRGDIKIINTFITNIIPCNDCRHCWENRMCSKHDDMTGIYEEIQEADNIVIATPVYFYSVPAPLKALIDRLQVYWVNKSIKCDETYLKHKNGLLMLAGGAPSFHNQFAPSILMLQSALKQINTEIIDVITFSNSDKNKIDDDKELIEKIISPANKLNCL